MPIHPLKTIAKRKSIDSDIRFRKLIENSFSGITLLDKDFHTVYRSPSAKRIVGWNSVTRPNQTVAALTHPDDRERVGKVLQEVLSSPNVPTSCTFRGLHHAGHYIWIQCTFTNMFDEPDVNAIVCNFVDATEHYLDQEKINKQNEQLQGVLQNITDGFIVLDENMCFTYANHQYGKILKVAPESLIGKNIWKVFPDKVGSAAYHAVQTAFKEQRYVCNEGYYAPLDLWQENRAFPSGNGVSLFIRDITNQKKEKDHLKLLESVIVNTKDAVLITDATIDQPGPRVLYVNEAFTKMTAYTSEEIVGKTPRILQGPKSDTIELKRLSDALHRTEECEITTINYKKNREEFWVNISVNPVFDSAGSCTHFIAIERDVTEQKIAEQEIKQLNERFALISKASNDALFEWNFEKKEVWWSESNFTMFGFDPKLPYPSREAWLAKIQPESRKVIEQIIIDVQEKNLNDWSYEINYTKPDQTKGVLLNRGFVMRNELQHPVRMLGSYIDISKQKNDEALNIILSDISQTFNESLELNITLDKVLGCLADFGNFSIAEVWLISSDKKKINLFSHSSDTDDMRTFFDNNPEYRSFINGEGLPGKTWETKIIQFWNNIDEDNNFLRKETAKVIGLKAAYGIPLFSNGEVIGVLVLGLNKATQPLIIYRTLFDELSKILGIEIKRKQLEWELNCIFNFAPDVICIAGIDGYFKKVNPAMSILLEYSEEELLTIKLLEFIHPDDYEITVKEFERVKNGAALFYFENRYKTKTGKIKWLSWTVAAPTEEGLLFCVAKDVTEKKDLENLLKKANTLARIGSWEIDLVKNTLYWSEMTKEIHETGSDFAPDVETAINFYKEGIDRSVIIQKVEETVQHGTPCDVELQIVTPAGKTKWVRVIGEAEFAGDKCIRIYGSFQDIDGRKKAEIAATAFLEDKNTILESIGDAFFAVDGNWIITYWNNTAEKLLNISREKAIDHNLWDVYGDFVNSESYRKYHEALETNHVVHFENYYKVLDKWHEVSAYPSGSGLSVFFKDVTERKNDEIQLKKLNETLNKQTKELSISNDELEQFAYVASHDLQEPLRMVTSFLTLLQNKYDPIIDDMGKQYIHFAVDGAKRMRQIILDLLDFSKVGNLESEREKVNLNKMVVDIIGLYRKKIEEKQATINYVGLPVLDTHRTPMRQVFQNLISNALKYSKPNIKPVIDITYKESWANWQFAVKDNGIGIDQEYFDKIFIIFQRLHNKDEYSGTGMGLAVTKKIIESLGGKIWVESDRDKGATFYFTIMKKNEL